MYVCICLEVKSKQITKAIASGHDSMDSLKENLNVATCCGCCQPMVQDFLDEHHTSKNDSINNPSNKNSIDVSRLAIAV